MALQNQLDPEQAATSLQDWWRSRHPQSEAIQVSDLHIPQSSGMSSETVLFRLSYRENGSEHSRELVARVIPASNQVFPSHDFDLERLAMDAVRTSTAAPAPVVHAVESDSEILGGPFLIMSRLYGDTLADDPPFTASGWLLELPADRQARLFDNAVIALAEIHRADISEFPAETLGHPDRGGRPLQQHIDHWSELYEWAAQGRSHPTIEAGLDWVRRNMPDQDSAATLCWGDARLGNLMFGADQQVTAVLDWELAHLGPPEIDLGWFCFIDRVYTDGFDLPNPPGFPSIAETVARYEELTGRAVRDFSFHEVYAGVRMSIVLMRLGTMMIEAGLLPTDAALPISNPPSHVLAGLLDLPAPAPDAGDWVTGHR